MLSLFTGFSLVIIIQYRIVWHSIFFIVCVICRYEIFIQRIRESVKFRVLNHIFHHFTRLSMITNVKLLNDV